MKFRVGILHSLLLCYLSLIANIECTIFNLTSTSWKAAQDLSFRISGRSIEFPCESTKSICKETEKYIPANILPTRAQMYLYDVIVAMPRYKPGVPITLGKAKLKCKGCPISVSAFPSWEYQTEGNCNAIQSAVDIYLDRNYVLWILDDGVVDSLETCQKKCPPKIVMISMITNKIVNSIDLSSYVSPNYNLQYIVAETAPNGDDYVYVTDAGGKSLIIINARCGQGKRLVFPSCITGTEGGVLYMSIVMKADFKSYLYFTCTGCSYIFSIETSLLRENDISDLSEIINIETVVDGDLLFCGTDKLSNIFFRYASGNDIYMWNANTACRKENWEIVQSGTSDRQVTQVATGPWKLLWSLESNVRDFVNCKAGYFGPSAILHPIVNDKNDYGLSNIINRLLPRF